MINIINSRGDSNLGLQMPTCVNIVDNLNRSAATAGLKNIYNDSNFAFLQYSIIKNLEALDTYFWGLSFCCFLNIVVPKFKKYFFVLILLEYLLLSLQCWNSLVFVWVTQLGVYKYSILRKYWLSFWTFIFGSLWYEINKIYITVKWVIWISFYLNLGASHKLREGERSFKLSFYTSFIYRRFFSHSRV